MRVIVEPCAQLPAALESLNVKLGFESQASLTLGVANDGVAEHSIVLAAGSEPITGPVVSTTVIVCDFVLLLPQWSVAVHVRVTEYPCPQLPAVVTSAKVSEGVPSHASVAVGEANDGVAGHSIVLAAGTAEITGAVVSTTVIVCAFVLLLPQ